MRSWRHYGLTVHSCVPFDPESMGGSEVTVQISMVDLVPTDANLLPDDDSSTELVAMSEEFRDEVNNRVQHETMRPAPAPRRLDGRRQRQRRLGRRGRGWPGRRRRPSDLPRRHQPGRDRRGHRGRVARAADRNRRPRRVSHSKLPDDLTAVLRRTRLPYLPATESEIVATATARRKDPPKCLVCQPQTRSAAATQSPPAPA